MLHARPLLRSGHCAGLFVKGHSVLHGHEIIERGRRKQVLQENGKKRSRGLRREDPNCPLAMLRRTSRRRKRKRRGLHLSLQTERIAPKFSARMIKKHRGKNFQPIKAAGRSQKVRLRAKCSPQSLQR